MQRGVKLSFTDYIPPQIPDAENFASIPLFEAVFRASDNNQEIPDPFKLPTAANGRLPKFSDPIKQERIDLIAWQKFFVQSKVLPVAGDNAAADVLQSLDSFAAPLAQLREAGTRPHCRFPVHWEKAFATELPHMTVLHSASKVYALRLASHLELGQSAAAYEDFRDGLRLITATLREPSLIAGLVRIANTVSMENSVWNGLASRQWGEPELRKIEADLAALDWLEDFVFAMNSERGGINLMIDLMMERPEQLAGVRQSDAESREAAKVLRATPSGWFYQNKVRTNHFIDEVLARIDVGRRRYFSERAVPSSPANITSWPKRSYYLLFGIIAPVLEGVEERYVQIASMTDQTRLACALERCRMSRGTFPAAIAELVPDYLPVMPVEILDGEPYRYRRTDDGGFVLYSIGTDMRDDGGVINPETSASKQSDWVWRYPVK